MDRHFLAAFACTASHLLFSPIHILMNYCQEAAPVVKTILLHLREGLQNTWIRATVLHSLSFVLFLFWIQPISPCPVTSLEIQKSATYLMGQFVGLQVVYTTVLQDLWQWILTIPFYMTVEAGNVTDCPWEFLHVNRVLWVTVAVHSFHFERLQERWPCMQVTTSNAFFLPCQPVPENNQCHLFQHYQRKRGLWWGGEASKNSKAGHLCI